MFKIDNSQASSFLVTCEDGSIRGASERLGIEPSSVSRQIKALEKSLNITLIERGRKGIRPTEAGRILLNFLKRQHSEQETLLSEFDALIGMRRGEIVIAVGDGFISDFIGNALTSFKKTYPGFTYDFLTGSTDQVLHAVNTERAHIGMAYNVGKDRTIRAAARVQQPLEVIMSPDSEWANMIEPIQMNDLESLPCGVLKSGFGVGDMIRSAENAHDTRLTATVRSNSLAVLRNFVREGLGVTILPSFVVTREIAEGKIITKSMQTPELNNGEASIFTRAGRHLPEGATRLLEHCVRTMSAFSTSN